MKARAIGIWCVALSFVVSGLAFAAESSVADAAKRQDTAGVRALLARQADVNAPQTDGATALHWAVHWNDVEMVDALLKARATVEVANDYGVTPLALAVENGSLPMVQRLLQAGANPNVGAETGETPLMTAVRGGHVAVVTALIAGGANVNAAGGGRDQTPLMWAIGQPGMVKVLLEHGGDVHLRSRRRPEYVSFGRGDPQGGRLNGLADGTLTSDGTRPGLGWIQKGGFTPFLFAAQQGDLESGKLLLAAGSDMNDRTSVGDTALMLAIHNDRTAFAAFLLDKGADPNATGMGYTALHLAAARRNLEIVKALLARGANPNVQLTRGEPFTEGSANLDQLPEYLLGATPFLLASALQQTEIMRALVVAGADPKLSMQDGTTPLMAAMGINPGVRGFAPFRTVTGGSASPDVVAGAGGGRRQVPKLNEAEVLATVKLTVELGVDISAARVGGVIYHAANARTRIGRGDGDTALHTATADKLGSVVEYLVDSGARLDQKDQWGLTPLGMATSKRHLIASGADDGGGKLGDPHMAELLQKLGAKE